MLFLGLKQLLCLVSALNMSHQHLRQYVQIQALALFSEGGSYDNNSIILDCGAAMLSGGGYYTSLAY